MTGPTLSPDDLLAGLDARQRAAVTAPRGPVAIVAGPGTGKTRTITHRIAYGVLTGQTPAGSVLAVTFTRRAAGEMRTRLAALGVPDVAARTFHSAASRQLRYFWPRLVGGPMPAVLTSPREAMAAVLAEVGWAPGTSEAGGARLVLAEVEWSKGTLTGPEDYAEAALAAGRRPPGGDATRLAEAYRAYEAFKVRHGRIDLTDIVLLLAAGIEDDRGVADEVRAAYRYLVVDEYQDVSPAQQRLLDAWLGDSDDVCVVGDPRQGIYSFAGATSAPLLELPRRYPHAVVVALQTCYRCTPEILRVADAVAADAPGHRLRSARRSGGAGSPGPGVPGAGVPAPGGQGTGCPEGVERHGFATLVEERTWLAERCASLVRAGHDPAEVAVLVRTRALASDVGAALAAAGVPVVVRDERAVLERPEAVEALALLRIAARLQRTDDAPVRTQVVDVLSGLGWSPAGPPRSTGGTDVPTRWLVLESIVSTVSQILADDADATLPQVVGRLQQMAEDGVEPVLRAVNVATMHASKGREWDVVFAPFLVDGIVPSSAATGPVAREEERHLLYVTVTRARRHLVLTWHRNGRGVRRTPSPLLPDLADEPTGPASPVRGGSRVPRQGSATSRAAHGTRR